MIKKLITLILFVLPAGCILTNAQTQRVCATYDHDQFLRSINPQYAKERDESERKIASYMASHPSQRNTGTTITIPVVVHIVWNENEPDQNLSDEQIVSQIDVLNEDYSISNANIVEVPSVWASVVGRSNFQFSLARQDENHNPTTGITRTKTSTPYFNTSDDVKDSGTGGCTGWDRNHFLNIWVCDLENGGSQAILGYAQYPTIGTSSTDGIVINYQAFGRTGTNLKSQYDLGRTATHEIGHWLNLYHTWGDDNGACSGTDYVDDTPNQGNATYGCPSAPHVSCSNGPNGDMFQDYMDYTDDKCMMLFTIGQISRMNSAFDTYRDSVRYGSSYITLVSPLVTDLKITNIIADVNSSSNVVCDKYIYPSLTVQNAGTNTITSFTINYRVENDSLIQFDWSGSLSSGSSVDVALPKILVSEDLHVLSAEISAVNGGIDHFPIDNFKTLSFLYSPSKYTCPVLPETPEIKIYPSPANDYVTIDTKYKTAQKATLSIYNVLGKKMFSADYLDSHGTLLEENLRNFASGVYVIEVKTFNQQVSKKFIVYHPKKK